MMNDLIQAQQVPSAIFAASDPIAIGALRALHQNGMKVPQDVSIIGFDNIDTANYTSPPLTTIFCPKRSIWDIWEQECYLMRLNVMKTFHLYVFNYHAF